MIDAPLSPRGSPVAVTTSRAVLDQELGQRSHRHAPCEQPAVAVGRGAYSYMDAQMVTVDASSATAKAQVRPQPPADPRP